MLAVTKMAKAVNKRLSVAEHNGCLAGIRRPLHALFTHREYNLRNSGYKESEVWRSTQKVRHERSGEEVGHRDVTGAGSSEC